MQQKGPEYTRTPDNPDFKDVRKMSRFPLQGGKDNLKDLRPVDEQKGKGSSSKSRRRGMHSLDPPRPFIRCGA